VTEPFLGEIAIFAFAWPPKGWARCDGATLPINQNAALYSLVGTSFGGDGRTTVGLPDMRGRVPVGYGNSQSPRTGGEETVTLTISQMPTHSHGLLATLEAGTGANANGGIPATVGAGTAGVTTPIYKQVPPDTPRCRLAEVVGVTGGSQPHYNMQPFLAVPFCIATSGLYPPRP
jgi:microcystin-dependent protein